jgi:glyoxylase-like metal-dependent hydrolase (beta-lactamase superfamily II)
MNMTDPIRRVSVVSTGQVQIRPDHLASTWRPTAWWLLASRRWTGPRPINAYVIMVGDLTYDAHLLEAGHVPGVGSRRRLREATAMINAMRQRNPGLVILPAHDPGAASRLAQATGQAPKVATA